MKLFLVLASLFLAIPAFAATNSQQNKMKDCNAQAKGMKGQDRKDFMKKCLSGGAAAGETAAKADAAKTEAAAPATGNSSQNRMKECNAQAKGKKGDERKKFLSSCLKKDAPAAEAPAKM